MKNEFDILNDVKVDIDEYEEIVFDNNDEFKKNIINKVRANKSQKLKKLAIVSSIAVIGTISLGVVNPEIIRAMPIIGKVIEGFDSSTFGSPMDKYIKYSEGVEISVTDKDTTISITDFIIDENIYMIGLNVESDVLSGYEGKNERDFVNVSEEIIINGKRPTGLNQISRQIDDTKGAVILSGNIADLNIEDKAKVKVNISSINQGMKEVSGNWEFKFEGDKVGGSQIIDINKEYDIKGQKLIIERLVTSPISSTIMLSGIDDTKNYTLQGTNLKVADDEGNILRTDIIGSSVDNKTGEFEAKIQIESDLSNTSYIELIPYWGMDTILKETGGIYSELLTTTGNGEREQIVISRNPTEEELDNGYAVDKVYHYLNIDKVRAFLSIEELIGYEIPVNNKDSVIIKNIDIDDKNTKITMQVKGNYEYLSQIVLFDEDMNDISKGEGHIGAVLEDEKEKIYSIELDKIDESKIYKIAIPQTKDIDLNSEDKIRINLTQDN
ncbi:MAG: DUF4179 domain-containing protein [Peptostreptococcaceae bacterium]